MKTKERKTGKLIMGLYEDKNGRLKETIQIFNLDGDKFVSTLDGTLIHLDFLFCLIGNNLRDDLDEFLENPEDEE